MKNYKQIIYFIFLAFIIFPKLSFSSENFSDAMQWYENRSKNPNDTYILALFYENKGDVQNAKQLFRFSAEKGFKPAGLRLGLILSNSKINDEIDEGLYWLENSLNNGYGEAGRLLGQIFEHGIKVNRDIDKAIYFYKKSIKFGENLSYLNLANLTLQGFENQPDVNLAIAYSFIASKKRVENAKLFLDELLPYIKEKEWYEVEILMSLIESEIKKM